MAWVWVCAVELEDGWLCSDVCVGVGAGVGVGVVCVGVGVGVGLGVGVGVGDPNIHVLVCACEVTRNCSSQHMSDAGIIEYLTR